jgi:hypothetical protein
METEEFTDITKHKEHKQKKKAVGGTKLQKTNN